ncbi:hypothetical protein E2C01_058418 [Portunus trituberculatus]|uniref:Uncharacterized protein n=1 Tax=Portunus trituberculatus TaxID=210409 RepID=A0A5B7H345_PORTR|nr:hypothetical protein [Portunus trituberculatus]
MFLNVLDYFRYYVFTFVSMKYSIVINYVICVDTLLFLLTTECQSPAQHGRGRGSLSEMGVQSGTWHYLMQHLLHSLHFSLVHLYHFYLMIHPHSI